METSRAVIFHALCDLLLSNRFRYEHYLAVLQSSFQNVPVFHTGLRTKTRGQGDLTFLYFD